MNHTCPLLNATCDGVRWKSKPGALTGTSCERVNIRSQGTFNKLSRRGSRAERHNATLGCKGRVDRWDRQGASGSNIKTQIARWTLYATSGLF